MTSSHSTLVTIHFRLTLSGLLIAAGVVGICELRFDDAIHKLIDSCQTSIPWLR
jgi:hypothetical protein